MAADLALHFAGVAEPDPGSAAWAWVLTVPDGVRVAEGSGPWTGPATGLMVAYLGLGFGLARVNQLALAGWPGRGLDVFGDSPIVVPQVTGILTCNVRAVLGLRDRCRDLVRAIEAAFGPVRFECVERGDNAIAVGLAAAAWEAAAGRPFPLFPDRPAGEERAPAGPEACGACRAAVYDRDHAGLGCRPECPYRRARA